MKNRLFLIVLLISAGLSASAQYRGTVSIDIDSKGKNQPLLGVMVSDGLNVVKTAADGTFELPGAPNTKFIIITNPSGYYATRGHYIPVKSGSGDGYDFLLKPVTGIAKDGKHSFIHISDTEIGTPDNHQEWIGNMRGYIASEKAAFLIHTGDICYEGGLKSHIKVMNTENMGCPVYYTIGNHDLVRGKYGEELFESIYGPVYYSFEVGNVHYIALPMLGGDYRPQYTKKDVYLWLKNDLAQVSKDKSVVAFCHDLLTYGDKFEYGIDTQNSIDLNSHNLRAWIFGHWHTNYVRRQGDVLAISTAAVDKGGIDHSVSGFRVVSAHGDGTINSELRYSYIDRSIEIVSVFNGKTALLPNGEFPLSVNAYHSESPVTNVDWSVSVDGKVIKSGKMNRKTDFNWNAAIPVKKELAGKNMIVTVSARLSNGELLGKSEAVRFDSEHKTNAKTGADWLNLLENPQHIGIAKDSISRYLELAWCSNVGGNILFTSPLVYDGKVYIATVDEDLKGEAGVVALSAVTGQMEWRYKTRNSVKNSISIDGGTIFAQDAQGFLYAIDARNGQLKWERKLDVNALPPIIEGLVASQGIVYAGSGKGLSAYKISEGSQLWVNKQWGQAEGATTTLALSDKLVMAGAQWRGLYANDRATGKLKWLVNSDGMSDRGASAAVHGDITYVISRSSLFILETSTGKVIARKELPYKLDVTSTPLVTADKILFGTANAGLVALHRETLETLWTAAVTRSLSFTGPYTKRPASAIETSPVLSGKTVFYGASDATLYGVDLNTGEVVWSHPTGTMVFSSVAVSGNTLYAADYAGNIYAFSNVEK